MQINFPDTINFKRLLDAGDGAFVALEVLDASTLFFAQTKEEIQSDGIGIAANTRNGFQLKAQANPQPFVTWWEGEMWGRSDTPGALIVAAVIYRVKKHKCGGDAAGGCKGGCGNAPQPGFDEGN